MTSGSMSFLNSCSWGAVLKGELFIVFEKVLLRLNFGASECAGPDLKPQTGETP